MRDPRRSYEAYEEFGERLDRVHVAMADVHGQLMDMWLEVDEQGAPEAQWFADHVLKVTYALKGLQREMAREFYAEIDDADVPRDKPRVPPSLVRDL